MIRHPDHHELKKFSEMHNFPFTMEQQLHSWNKAVFSIGKKYFNILMKIQKGEFQEIYTFGITVLYCTFLKVGAKIIFVNTFVSPFWADFRGQFNN